MKTDVVIIDKGKREEATSLLQKSGFTVYGPMRFRFDVNTAVVTAIGTAVLAALISLL